MPVDFGTKADGDDVNDGAKYGNKRAEMWGRMREWLKIGAIPEKVSGAEITMVEELTAPTYSLNGRDEIILESKRDMRRRGVKSPNIADALACTFAFNFYERTKEDRELEKQAVTPDYNPYASEYMSQ
jgi:hypothetical protein